MSRISFKCCKTAFCDNLNQSLALEEAVDLRIGVRVTAL